MNKYHTSVLLQEVLTYLQVTPGKLFIDATLGGGGHTEALLDQGGIVLGLDADEEAISHVRKRLEGRTGLTLARGNFRDIDLLAQETNFTKVSGILFDVGVSSHQLDEAARGFSFQDGPLDMRMDDRLSVTAADLVNGMTNKELQEMFVSLGEERYARSIAKNIVEQRKERLFETTGDLIGVIRQSAPNLHSKVHPATRVFQALRIAVNDELHALDEALPKAVELLESGGRLVVISFHSLEDRIVKRAFVAFEEAGKGEVLTKRPIEAQEDELGDNRRSRSAKLRVFQKA